MHRTTREHHLIDRYQNDIPQKSKTLRLDGEGIILGTSKKISTNINELNTDKLVQIHRLFYGTMGVATERLMNVLAFCGLEQTIKSEFNKNSKRVQSALEKKSDEVIDELIRIFCLRQSNKRIDKLEEIFNFIVCPSRPNCDEQIDFRDEALDEIVEEQDQSFLSSFGDLDASTDDGEIYIEDEDLDLKKPKTRNTRKSTKKTTKK
ncbi:hypothetical protein ENUP19_0061G0145 [Entamoeba nuttalli]|uniref:Uncharacterized protein n=2 Tax=Entamoeba nuttalli TaxID=412467 RepID=K2GW21_ENTNP|nr:hypothetical protein ENU1_131290 [Entamoeba nuttalli P19]EKE39373.1 hypothetical protein ENU1_131290 [Entamoeba nuttalli P19]|eukprot:XP_008858292.1 hypothetical protein ENU1_131290 [Entamoeba nuttalli P19]